MINLALQAHVAKNNSILGDEGVQSVNKIPNIEVCNNKGSKTKFEEWPSVLLEN